jgi:parallel beta-helix repeat protein
MVTNLGASGPGSLRAAIDEANLTAEVDTIEFEETLSTGTITLTSQLGALPLITAPLIIRTDNHPAYTPSSPPFTLDGSQLSVGSGFQFNFESGSSFRQNAIIGMRIRNFPDDGIEVTELSDNHSFNAINNIIEGNGRLSIGAGINISGTISFGPEFDLVDISNNTIVRNDFGIRIVDLESIVRIGDNRIGTNGTSTTDANTSTGILLDGVFLADASNSISGNIVSGNGGDGISIRGMNQTSIRLPIFDNIIGVNESETAKIPNNLSGIRLENAAAVDLSVNTISGNNGNGITVINTNGGTIEGNVVGTDRVSRTRNLANGGAGIELTSSARNCTVAGNHVYFNPGDGIRLTSTAGNGNRLSINNFRANGGEHIDLSNDGHTSNDDNDIDTGPNRRLNFPVIVGSQVHMDSAGRWIIPVQFDVDVAGDYRFELYRLRNGVLESVLNELGTAHVPSVGDGVDFSGTFVVFNGTQLDRIAEGDQLAMLAIGEASTGNNLNATSELSRLTDPITSTLRVVDVQISGRMANGDPWVRAPYSYETIVPTGMQLAPIYTQGVNKIGIEFNDLVVLDHSGGGPLTILGTPGNPPVTTSFDGFTGNVANWIISGGLPKDKYRIVLDVTKVSDASGTALDGEWENLTNNTADNFNDDPKNRVFVSGDGVPGAIRAAFEFFVSILSGDYTQDGVVDTLDDDLGNVKDGDGDGVIEDGQGEPSTEDTQLASTNNGMYLPLRKNQGDYVDNDWVDGEASLNAQAFDYAKWRSQFGMMSPPAPDADGNLNGTVDAADYVVWQVNSPLVGAWYIGPFSSAAALPLVDIGEPPKVVDVIVSGSLSTHAPFSFTTVDGSGLQLRTVPVGAADTISIVFSEDVNVVASNLRLVGLQTGNVPTLAEFHYDLATMTAIWRFEGWTLGDQYAISLSDAVTDIEGNRLDGEWVNPAARNTINSAVSEFPSGDGEPGGDFNFAATLLNGDFNMDGIVNQTDADILEESWVAEVVDALFTDGDNNGDGQVNSMDFFIGTSGLNLQALWLMADLDGDFDVDDEDVDCLADHLHMSNPTWADGDLNDDGTVNYLDVDLILAQYGLDLEAVA